jgi:hypothetical protein
MDPHAPAHALLSGAVPPWSLAIAGTVIGWAVTLALYIKAKVDLHKARAKAAVIAKVKDALDAVIALAPFLAPVVGPILQSVASAATAFVEPPQTAPPSARRNYAGVGSPLHQAIVGKLDASLVSELEALALAKLAEHERKKNGDDAPKAEKDGRDVKKEASAPSPSHSGR